jgi:hypothetical protein
MLFYGINFMASFSHMKGAFLRQDWVTLLVVSVCLLRAGCHKTAGAVMAYPALARVFPVIFVFGPAAKLVVDLIRKRTLNRACLGFLVAFVLMGILLVAVSVWDDGGVQGWRDFAQKIGVHNDDISSWRLGFKYLFIGAYRPAGMSWTEFRDAKKALFDERQVLWWIIQGLVLIVCVCLVRNLEDYESVAFSFVPLFFLVAPTFYYYIMLLVPFFFFAPKIEQTPRAIGLAALFAFSAVACAMCSVYGLTVNVHYGWSWILLGFVVYMMILAMLAKPARLAADTGPSSVPIPLPSTPDSADPASVALDNPENVDTGQERFNDAL